MKAREICYRSGERGIGEWRREERGDEKKEGFNGGCIIDHDMTKREREVQRRLRRIVERERKGEYVKVGYGKILIEGKWWKWEEEKEEVEKVEGWRKREEKEIKGEVGRENKGQSKEEDEGRGEEKEIEEEGRDEKIR